MTTTEKVGYHELTETVSEYKWTLYNFLSFNESTGQYINSQTFLSNGIKWNIRLYPNGDFEGHKEYISLYLCPISNFKTKVNFEFSMSNDTKVLGIHKYQYTFPFNSSLAGYGSPKFINRNTVLANLKEKNDTLTIVVKIFFSSVTQETIYLNLLEDVDLLLETRENSDVILVSNDESEHKAHKAILACRSKVFSAMFQHKMKESQDNVIKIEDMDNETLDAMLHFVYSGELVIVAKDLYEKLLIAADKYEFNDLRRICVNYLHDTMDFDNVLDLIKLSYTYNISELKLKAKEYFLQNHKEILSAGRRENLKDLTQDIVEDLLCDLSSDLSSK